MLDLDPDNKTIVLNFDYSLAKAQLGKFQEAFQEEQSEDEKKQRLFVEKFYKYYFELSCKSVLYEDKNKEVNEDVFRDITAEKSNLDKIIQFRYISATRDISNKENYKHLSGRFSKIYDGMKGVNNEQINSLETQLEKVDKELTKSYQDVFKTEYNRIKRFGGMKLGEVSLKVESRLQGKNILSDNTHVVYGKDKPQEQGFDLPESYQGLGYMNLMILILDIELRVKEFKKSASYADINLLFIEDRLSANNAQSMACITYTNAATQEIRQRVQNKELYVETIHEFL